MRSSRRTARGQAALAVALALLGALPSEALAGVRVVFVDPERHRDIDRAGGVLPPRAAMAEIVRFLKVQGNRLRPNEDLRIEILDFNLAGVTDPVRPEAHSTRFLDRTTWPSFRVRYTLREGGRTVASGEELVADREYLNRPYTSFASDPLRYEKNMLYDWFDARFVLRRAPAP